MGKYELGDRIPDDLPYDPAVAADLDDRHLTVIFGTVVSMHDFDGDGTNPPAKPAAKNCRRCR